MQSAGSDTRKWLTDSKTGLKNSPNAGTVISCVDSGGAKLDEQQLQAKYAEYEGVSKFFGGISVQYVYLCDGAKLNSQAKDLAGAFENVKTANPIMFVSNTADPTTPIRNAHSMSAAFPGSGVLTVNGTGHLSYNAAQHVKCVADRTAQYFRDGTLPPEGTVCEGMQDPFESSGE